MPESVLASRYPCEPANGVRELVIGNEAQPSLA
jgi:hypothetical protein